MLAIENLRAGDLAGSLNELQNAVRAEPADSKNRIFLFQLLAVMGDWKRALTQLKVLGEMDASTLPMVQTYREALQCEVFRDEVFAGKRSPLVFGDPEAWVAELIQAVGLSANGHYDQAAELHERAFEAAPTTSGSIDGEPFEWIADADERLGPIFEMIVNGHYYWVPVHRMQRLDLDEPVDLRDLVWTPASVTWANGGTNVALVPTRYPGTERSDDDSLRLARRTEWIELSKGYFAGVGQRMFGTDNGTYPIMDARQLQFDTSAGDGESATGDPAGA